MKIKNVFALTALLIFAIGFQTQAQRGMRAKSQQACLNIPNLTDEQQDQLETMRTQRIAASTAHRAEMNELRARKRSISISENPDMNELENIIDQMAELRAEHIKSAANHRQQVREMLTSEQRVYFDRMGKGNRQGRGRFDDSRGGRSEFGDGTRGMGRRR